MKKIYAISILLFSVLFGCPLNSIAQTYTFPYIGAMQTWTVPAGVSSIFVDAQGAKGGAAGPVGGMIGFTTPGCGGRVQANLAVTPGQVLNINVGGSGQDGVGFTYSMGGYNGGGYAVPWSPPAPSFTGGGGGGKSDITVGTTTMIVAGGGGGAGYNGACPSPDQPGGNGGGITGASAITCDITLTGLGFTTIIHAGGGGPTSGGSAGWICCGGYYAGTAGALGVGGNNVDSGGIGGAGGGGYYGGGGGCWTGGGGGSSYTNPAAAIAITHTQGYNCADGIVIICVLPDAGTITGTTTLCAGATTSLGSTGVGGGVWSSSSSSVATVSSSGLVSGVSAGTAVISYALTSACGTAYATATVTVNPLPDPGTITGTPVVCLGAPTSLTSTGAAGGTWTSSATTVATVNSSGTVTGLIAGTTVIRYTVTTICGTASTTVAVTVSPVPNAGTITGIDSVCPGHTVILSDATPGGVWSSSNTSISTVTSGGIVTGVSTGVDTIFYTVTVGGCSGIAKKPFKVRSVAACIVGINTPAVTSMGTSLRVYPNPNPGTFTIGFSPAIKEEVHFIITNIMGEKIKEIIGSIDKPIDIQLDVPNGIYLLHATTDNGKWNEKIMIIK